MPENTLTQQSELSGETKGGVKNFQRL